MTALADEGMDWRQKGACKDYDPTLWWPEELAGSKAIGDRAKAICHAECLVRRDCLKWALDHDERFGIWGGYSPQEREYIRQRRQQ